MPGQLSPPKKVRQHLPKSIQKRILLIHEVNESQQLALCWKLCAEYQTVQAGTALVVDMSHLQDPETDHFPAAAFFLASAEHQAACYSHLLSQIAAVVICLWPS